LSTLQFGTWYESAFHDHVTRAEEETLRAAYELGREAVRRGLGLLDLADVHHAALLSEIRLGGADSEAVVRAAREFLVESVSAYEMVRRGFEEARHAALVQASRQEMLRQLSGFLADASLASTSPESLEEVLRLIAEQGRELIGARLCVVSVTAEGQSLQASSYAARDPDGAGEVGTAPLSTVAPSSDRSETRLVAALRSLDGNEIGSLEIFDKEEGDFAAVDEAALVHLSQMASAAVERVLLHMAKQLGAHRREASDP
jgi:GAF domain-containing protein